MQLQIMTRYGMTSFVHQLRWSNSAAALLIEINELVKWFIESVPIAIRGHSDIRIVVKHMNTQPIFQFTMDCYEEKEHIKQEMRRFERALEAVCLVSN